MFTSLKCTLFHYFNCDLSNPDGLEIHWALPVQFGIEGKKRVKVPGTPKQSEEHPLA